MVSMAAKSPSHILESPTTGEYIQGSEKSCQKGSGLPMGSPMLPKPKPEPLLHLTWVIPPNRRTPKSHSVGNVEIRDHSVPRNRVWKEDLLRGAFPTTDYSSYYRGLRPIHF